MKEHEPKTDVFWRQVIASQPRLTQGDYEEWRNNPVTKELFDDLEYSLLIKQGEITQIFPTDPSVASRQAELHAYGQAIGEIFSWSPEGITLEDEYNEG